MLMIVLMAFAQEPASKDKSSLVMPFMKVETIGVSPINQSEKIIYRKSAGDKIVREFKTTPVFIIKYEKMGDKLISKFNQVGTASCVFFTDNNWLSASIEINDKVPDGYVLRAHTVARKNDIAKDKTLEVQDASIIEFYLKPKELSVDFK